ncbi:alanine racemase [Clostridium intestinale]|uniref:Alanine racemase n=1 Tax=Clostridium intestinale TaxID=36845 RepID=A0A7D6ZVU0_9CLOT|nr:alanine racemase [Clostridium intestinale]QLY78634.1 alanine racemase [Clostridium intestinale]
MNVWCEVYKDKIIHNVDLIKKKSSKKLMAVIKSNAYGLGINEISSILSPLVDSFAVSTLEEAQSLTIEKDILVLTPLCVFQDYNDINSNIILTIDDEEDLSYLNMEKQYRVHIYVNTGMNRFGIEIDKLPKFIDYIKSNYKNVIIEGIYTHLHNAKNTNYSLKQIENFKRCVTPYIGIIPNIHCLNSNGFLNDVLYEACDFTNFIRIGNLLYGYSGLDKGFKQTYSFKSKILKSFKVTKGNTVGYGDKYKAPRDMLIGVLPIGKIHNFYCSVNRHGLSLINLLRIIYRFFVPLKELYFEDNPINIISQPNMDNTLIDATHLKVGDIITVKLSPIIADSSIKRIYINSN